MPNINLSSLQKYTQAFKSLVKTSGEANVDKKTFLENVSKDVSIFESLDFDGDKKISESELNTASEADSDNDGKVSEKELACMHQMKFSARRNVDKWFSLDVNRDGHWSNVEYQLGEKRMFGDTADDDSSLDASMTNEQLAKLYNMEEEIPERMTTLEEWLDGWIQDFKEEAKKQYGVELNEKQIIVIKNEYKKQLNTWLFKTGDNATGNAPLYNSLNNTAYTRLCTDDAAISCCGGNIVPPPAAKNKNSCTEVFSSMNMADSQNNSTEVKNRLAWAVFKTPSKEKLDYSEEALTLWDKMSDEEYAQYHNQYKQIRNMKSSEFRDLLKPENEQKRIEFEKKSNMTVRQIVDYINIVERQIGEGNFDSDNWSIDIKQFNNIITDINDTTEDENRLKGKTRSDVPENRQALLRFLEEKGWLYEQFKN